MTGRARGPYGKGTWAIHTSSVGQLVHRLVVEGRQQSLVVEGDGLPREAVTSTLSVGCQGLYQASRPRVVGRVG